MTPPSFRILPSILAADHGRFLEEVQSIGPECDILHVDVMDGQFVPVITFGHQVVASLRRHTSHMLDVHLMIDNVDAQIPLFAEAGADIITIHQEASRHLHRSLQLIRSLGAKAGIALNPATPLESIKWVLEDVDLVLIMSVNPGFGGQLFIPQSLEKIRQLAQLRRAAQQQFIIEVDGGVNQDTAAAVHAAGAEYLVAGSAVFGAENRARALAQLRRSVEENSRSGGPIYT